MALQSSPQSAAGWQADSGRPALELRPVCSSHQPCCYSMGTENSPGRVLARGAVLHSLDLVNRVACCRPGHPVTRMMLWRGRRRAARSAWLAGQVYWLARCTSCSTAAASVLQWILIPLSLFPGKQDGLLVLLADHHTLDDGHAAPRSDLKPQHGRRVVHAQLLAHRPQPRLPHVHRPLHTHTHTLCSSS